MPHSPIQAESVALELETGPPVEQATRSETTSDVGIIHSRDTLLKLASAGLSFLCAGLNDGSLGALIPYILRSYNISSDLVSVVCVTMSLSLSSLADIRPAATEPPLEDGLS